jgi:hypothetical protein
MGTKMTDMTITVMTVAGTHGMGLRKEFPSLATIFRVRTAAANRDGKGMTRESWSLSNTTEMGLTKTAMTHGAITKLQD